MPKLIFTQPELEAYFKDKRHHFYGKTVDIANEMLVHADGVYPAVLLDERRPNESPEVQEYRKKIWQPKTKPTFAKIFNSLQKIRRSQDWSINYPDDEFNLINEDQTLEQYCEHNYPYFTSVTNWLFSVYLRKYLTDPNALVVVVPLVWEVLENEHLQPIAKVFESPLVYEYVENDFCVLQNPMGCEYVTGRGRREKGKSMLIVTTQEFLKPRACF
jgi:hypothetical protein